MTSQFAALLCNQLLERPPNSIQKFIEAFIELSTRYTYGILFMNNLKRMWFTRLSCWIYKIDALWKKSGLIFLKTFVVYFFKSKTIKIWNNQIGGNKIFRKLDTEKERVEDEKRADRRLTYSWLRISSLSSSSSCSARWIRWIRANLHRHCRATISSLTRATTYPTSVVRLRLLARDSNAGLRIVSN